MRAVAHDPGIAPVPPGSRLLGPLDSLVLWASLGVGLLVLVTGSYLVPALGLAEACAAIVTGSALGGLILGLIAFLGARTHVPGMVLLRAPLGVRGSFAPTALNVAQSFGWTVFEVIVIAQAAHAAAGGPVALWTIVASAVVTALAIGGPLVVVRRVLRAIGVPIVLAAGLYLTIWSARHLHWQHAQTATGGLTFWLGVDLAIAIPISWAPLVADYARFSSSPRAALVGTALGTTVANAWFYLLGAALALVGAADPSIGVRPVVGVLALGALALAECDKPFADLYSTVVSIQNVRPRWSTAMLVLPLGVAVAACALAVGLTDYETFLFLLGSCFVPLAGVLLGHAARVGAYAVDELYAASGRYGSANPWSLLSWGAGFVVYQWIAPSSLAVVRTTVDWLLPTAPTSIAQLGASIPSFLTGAALAFLAARLPVFRPQGLSLETGAVQA